MNSNTSKEVQGDFLDNNKTENRDYHKSYFGHEVKVQLVQETAPTVEYWINKPEDVFKLVRNELMILDREAFLVVSLNTDHKVLGLNIISIGILDQSIVHPREVFKSAILLNALCIILVHNHPSGNPKPSTQDLRVTEILSGAGKLLSINVIDHVIVANNIFYSFLDNGLL